MSDANTVMEKLCSHCADYLKNLPTSEKDTRVAALVAWCLAYKCEDYDKLPIYWHKVVGTLLIGLRLCRVQTGFKNRSDEVTQCCKDFIEYLWSRSTRHYIALHSRGCWAHCRLSFQQYYDTLWTIWRNVT